MYLVTRQCVGDTAVPQTAHRGGARLDWVSTLQVSTSPKVINLDLKDCNTRIYGMLIDFAILGSQAKGWF